MKTIFLPLFLSITGSIFALKPVSPPNPVFPVPTQIQLDWMSMELNAFIHFTTNTFTDLEWGNGDESESVFNPTACDPDQWTAVLQQAGFKGLILTCKHHDGFCLWPSAFTQHSIKNSPYRNGKGDLVREVSDACKKAKLQFGIYLSPWDRNHADYARPEYIAYYRSQLEELIRQYGPIFELWLDGANGGTGFYGGDRGRRTINSNYYDWPATIKLARTLQQVPFVVLGDNGPDARWVGNEEGWAGKTNWYGMDPDSCYVRRPGFEHVLASGMENGSHWIPTEVDVSIRPGWFYHASEDAKVKTAAQLFEIYLQSVGRGSMLLLNIPPDRRGLFHENDVQALQGFRRLLDQTFCTNLARTSSIHVSSVRGGSKNFDGKMLLDGKKETYWATDDSITSGSIELRWKRPQTIRYVVLQEYLSLGQRIKTFTVEAKMNNTWVEVASETTIGIKRIVRIPPVHTQAIRIRITNSRACPTLSGLEIY